MYIWRCIFGNTCIFVTDVFVCCVTDEVDIMGYGSSPSDADVDIDDQSSVVSGASSDSSGCTLGTQHLTLENLWSHSQGRSRLWRPLPTATPSPASERSPKHKTKKITPPQDHLEKYRYY